MGVDDVVAVVLVPGEMDLAHPVLGNARQIVCRIEAVIEGRDIDVVDVEQQVAIGPPRQFGQEVPFVHGIGGEGDIGRGVFQGDTPSQDILHMDDPRRHMVQGFLGQGQGQQIVQVDAVGAGPAQMVGDDRRVDQVGQRLEVLEIIVIQRVGRADRQRHPMHGHGTAFAHGHQVAQRHAAHGHEVFRDDFKPVDAAQVFVPVGAENIREVLRPQAEPKTFEGILAESHGRKPSAKRKRGAGCLRPPEIRRVG